MTARAAVRIDDVANPLALTLDSFRNPVTFVPCSREIALAWQPQQREPILRGIIGRCGLLVRRRNGLQIHRLARRRLDLRGIDQSVPTDPHIIISFWQVGHKVATLIVRHHAFN